VIQLLLPLHECATESVADPAAAEFVADPVLAESTSEPLHSVADSAAVGAAPTECVTLAFVDER
jgi:hypothetical protein